VGEKRWAFAREQLLAGKSEGCDLATQIIKSTIGRDSLKLEIIMKAIIVKAPGGLDRIERIEQPDPGPPGPGTIRVRLHASSLNFHDYGVVSTPNRVSDGRIPMSDGAGVVEAVGEGVTQFKVNDRVVSCFFPGWADGAPTIADFSTVPGDGVDGYAREIVVAPTTAFTRAPEGYSFAEAATLTTAGVTAWRALVINGALKAGDTVLRGNIWTMAGVKFICLPACLAIRAACELSEGLFIGVARTMDVRARQTKFSLQTERLLKAPSGLWHPVLADPLKVLWRRIGWSWVRCNAPAVPCLNAI
jgi:hypothetical protein